MNTLIEFSQNGSDGSGLAQMSRRWKNTGERMTAFKQINIFRRDLALEDFEVTIAGNSPSNVNPLVWAASISAFKANLEKFNRETNYSIEPEALMREVAFDLENESRRAYDAMTERYVEVLHGLKSSGRLESEMAELDPALLSIVRAGIIRIPQPQLQL